MKVILLRDVKNIGRKYEIREVNDGFARNGLINKGAALPATVENAGKLKAEMDKVARTAAERQEFINHGLEKIKTLTVTISGRSNHEGHLFAAIHPLEIVAELQKSAGIKINPDWLEMKPIKKIGEHDITVKIDNHRAAFKLIIKPN